MDIAAEIHHFISQQDSAKQHDLLQLHELMLTILPTGKLWMEDGKNEAGKVVTNPTIGYGNQTLLLAKGKSREMFQIGISANTSGISIYLIGIRNKLDLAHQFGAQLGKAKVTGYCIKFKQLADIEVSVLAEAICLGIALTNG
ncbi:MAG: DUF1801 domain-containing protein [Fluviicola sp.]|nr:DUF1801 domain-containing protein [Fluviicola sp.]